MPGLTTTDLDAIFSYHAPSAAQVAQYEALRAQAKDTSMARVRAPARAMIAPAPRRSPAVGFSRPDGERSSHGRDCRIDTLRRAASS
jgi:hypothetical protein